MTRKSDKRDIYAEVTDQIVAAIPAGAGKGAIAATVARIRDAFAAPRTADAPAAVNDNDQRAPQAPADRPSAKRRKPKTSAWYRGTVASHKRQLLAPLDIAAFRQDCPLPRGCYFAGDPDRAKARVAQWAAWAARRDGYTITPDMTVALHRHADRRYAWHVTWFDDDQAVAAIDVPDWPECGLIEATSAGTAAV